MVQPLGEARFGERFGSECRHLRLAMTGVAPGHQLTHLALDITPGEVRVEKTASSCIHVREAREAAFFCLFFDPSAGLLAQSAVGHREAKYVVPDVTRPERAIGVEGEGGRFAW